MYAQLREHDRRTVLLEDLAHLGRVPRIREHGGGGEELALVDELALDLEEARLAVVDEHEAGSAPCGRSDGEAPGDRAARARHEDDLALEIARDGGRIDLDGLSRKVLHLDRPDLSREVEVTGDPSCSPGASSRGRLRPGRARRSARARRPGRRDHNEEELVGTSLPQKLR